MDDYKIIIEQEHQTVIDKLKAFLSKFLNTSDSYLPKIVDVEDDTELCNHIKTRLHMDGNISDGDLQIEVQKRFGERYPGMSNNDWRHIIEAYTPMVREASKPKAKEIPLDYPMAAEDE